jgi:polyphenol oxidase
MGELNRLSDLVMKCVSVLVLVSMTLVVIDAQAIGGPIPAANLPSQCNSKERCCMPRPYKGKEMYQFKYENLPMRTRPAAHTVSADYIRKIEKGYKILRELPDTDPRSLLNQMRLHCLYCDHGLFFPGVKYPLAIHNGWLFVPWHRMFLYFHERILQKVLNDDTFALPYWAWDLSLDVKPAPNMMPAMYANPSSPLYNPNRNNCSFPPFVADMDTTGGCPLPFKTPDYLRIQNDRIMYTQLVLGAPTTSLFYGMPYRFGDVGGAGQGTFEDMPHGTIHLWLGNKHPARNSSRRKWDDMGNFGRAAFDPIFYAHHGNIDRLWNVWLDLPGRARDYPKDPVFLDTQFTFYDHDANLVKANVSQFLDIEKLRYKYEKLPTPWVTNGVLKGKENSIARCSPLSKTAVEALISQTPKHKKSMVLNEKPVTFKVNRGTRKKKGTEVLEMSGIHIPDAFEQVHWKLYLFFPGANLTNSGPTCPEFAGTFNFIPVQGQATFNPKRVWRVAIRPKLQQLGMDYVDKIVVTIVSAPSDTGYQNVTFDKAKIIYDTSPDKTL